MIVLWQVSSSSPPPAAPSLTFWLANTSELLHFLTTDRHVHSYAARARVTSRASNEG